MLRGRLIHCRRPRAPALAGERPFRASGLDRRQPQCCRGGLLKIEDYLKIGKDNPGRAEERYVGLRLAVLEGGYHPDLRRCVKIGSDSFKST